MKKFIKEIFSEENLRNAMAGMLFVNPSANVSTYLYLSQIKKNSNK